MGHYVAGRTTGSLFGKSYTRGDPVDTSDWPTSEVTRMDRLGTINWVSSEPGRGSPTPAPATDAGETDGAKVEAKTGDGPTEDGHEDAVEVYHRGAGRYHRLDTDEPIEETGKDAVQAAGYAIVDRPVEANTT